MNWHRHILIGKPRMQADVPFSEVMIHLLDRFIRLGCSCLAPFTSTSQKFPEMVSFLIKKSLESDSFHL